MTSSCSCFLSFCVSKIFYLLNVAILMQINKPWHQKFVAVKGPGFCAVKALHFFGIYEYGQFGQFTWVATVLAKVLLNEFGSHKKNIEKQHCSKLSSVLINFHKKVIETNQDMCHSRIHIHCRNHMCKYRSHHRCKLRFYISFHW